LKKLVSFFSLVILSLSLTACGAKNSSGTSFNIGKLDNTNYINTWINIKIEQMSGWGVIPGDQLGQMVSDPNNVLVGLDDSKNNDFINGNASAIYPIGFININSNANLIVTIEKASSNSNEAVNKYVDDLKAHLKDLESQGTVFTVQDPKSATIGEFQCTEIVTEADFSDSKLVQNYFLKPKDNYLFVLMTTSPSDNGTNDINDFLNNIKKAQ